MKTILSISLFLTLLLPLGAVPDQEAPAAPAPKPDEKAAAENDDEEKGPGFLGVRGRDVDEALADQLELKQGVILLSVEPGTPAAKAGLQVNDVITGVDETEVGTMLELRDAIREHKEGAEITLKLVQKGKRVEKKVTLAAAPALPEMVFPQGGLRIVPGAGFQGRGIQWNFEGAGQFRLGDQEGSVELKGEGEAREVTVRDHGGRIVYEGPWVTPQDKAAPTPDVRKRIERIANMWGGGGLPFQRRFLIPPELELDLELPGLPPAPAPGLPPQIDKDFGRGFGAPKEDKPEDGEAEKGEPEDDPPAEDPPKNGRN